MRSSFFIFLSRRIRLRNSSFLGRSASGVAISLIAGFFALSAFASATVTPATGGTALSADLSTGTFATLTGPIVSEGATGDIGVGTIILNAPAGFTFDTGGTAPTVLVTRIAGTGSATRNLNDLASGSTIAVTRASTTLSITITAATSNSVRNSLTWQDVRVRPSAGTPLASGNITKSGTAAITGVTSETNFGTLTETAGAKSVVQFSTQASASAIVGANIPTPPTVRIADQFGNTVASDQTSTISLVPVLSSGTCVGPSGTGSLTLTPPSGSSVTSGVLAFTTLRYSAAESIRLCASSAGIASALGDVISVENPVPVLGSLVPTSALSGSVAFTLQVAGSNFVSGSTVLWNGSPRTTTFSSSTALSASIPASDLVLAGTASVSVQNPTPGGGTSASLPFTITPAATKFVILPPLDGTVDAPIAVTIEAQKSDGSQDTAYGEDVTLVTGGSSTGGGLINIVNGVGAASVSDTLAETAALSLTDTEGTGLNVSSTEDIVFRAGVLAALGLNDPGGITAGTRAAYAVERTDQYGNDVLSGTTTIGLFGTSPATYRGFFDVATGGTPITAIAIASGTPSALFWYEEGTAGTWTVTASDNLTAPDGTAGIADAGDSIVVAAGVPTIYILNDPGNMTAGTRIGYTLTRKDAFGNAAVNGGATAYLSTSAPGDASAFFGAASGGSPIASIAFLNGASTAAFWYEEGSIGAWTVTASDNLTAPDGAAGIADASDAVVVTGAPIVPTRIVIRPVSSATVDTPATVTIALEDGSGNTASTATGTVTLHTTGSATGGGIVTLTNGIGTAAITDHVAETISLSLSDTGGTGLDVSSTRMVVFAAGALAQLAFDAPGNMAAGSRLGFVLTRKDQYGNVVTSGSTNAYLSTTGLSSSSGFFGVASGGGVIASIMFLDGSATAALWYEDERAGSVTITASDNPTAPDGAAGVADALRMFTVVAGGVAQLALNDPGDMTAGTRLPYTVSRTDSYGNAVTAGVQTVALYTTSPASGSGFFDVSLGGSKTTIAVFPDGASSANFWYQDATPGIWTLTASDNPTAPDGAAGIADASDTLSVLAAPIVATRLTITAPASGEIGVSVTATIRAENANGDLDTTATGTVTLHTTGSATGGGIVTLTNGIGTAAITDHVAETISLSLSDTGGTGLDVSSTRMVVFAAGAAVVGASGQTGASDALLVSAVRVSGSAPPGILLNVVGLGGESSVRGTARSRIDGQFALALSNVDPLVRSFGVYATDAKGRRTQMKIIDANRADASLAIALSGIVLSPTIGPARSAVTKGDVLGFDGAANAGALVEVEIDGRQISETIRADAFGRFRGLIDTRELREGSHTIRAWQRSVSGEASDYSPQQVFAVVRIFTPELDHNGDGTINIQDWSIFVERWYASDPLIRLQNDLNGDGTIDIRDASIFIKTLAPAPRSAEPL